MTREFLSGAKNRLLQLIALHAPGGDTVRVALHRHRGVEIGRRTWIGDGALIEPLSPHRVAIGDGVAIGIRVLILAHFVHAGRNRETANGQLDDRVSVRIEDDAFVGPGAMIMPNVTIGRGAVVAAGSVVTRSVAPLTMVQGNPAAPIARCTVPLGLDTPIKEFVRGLTPIESPTNGD